MKILSFGNRPVGMMAYRNKMDGKWSDFMRPPNIAQERRKLRKWRLIVINAISGPELPHNKQKVCILDNNLSF